MTILYKQGDVVHCSEDYLAHGCNAQGYFNAGVARAIRIAFPRAAQVYLNRHKDNSIKLGEIIPVYTGNKVIFNCITQRYFGRDPKIVYADYHAIQECMVAIRYHVPEGSHVAMPRIGAGLANGDWSIIEGIIVRSSHDWYTPVVYSL